MKPLRNTIILLAILMGVSCQKEVTCNNNLVPAQTYWSTFGGLYCNTGQPFQFYATSKQQLDSIKQGWCQFVNTNVFPVDDANYIYLAFCDSLFYRQDTFYTSFLKDTCDKVLYCDFIIQQRTDTLFNFPGPAIAFYEIEDVPGNYTVKITRQRKPR